jgi:Putative prokaryotic signal transducing protein
MDSQDLVTVYTVSNPIEAEIIKNALEEEGITSFVEGGMQAAESGLTGLPVRIDVPVGDAERARSFIEAHEQRRRQQNDLDND